MAERHVAAEAPVERQEAHLIDPALDLRPRLAVDGAADAGDVALHLGVRSEVDAAAHRHHLAAHLPFDPGGTADGRDAVLHVAFDGGRAADGHDILRHFVLVHRHAAADVDAAAGAVPVAVARGRFGRVRSLCCRGLVAHLGLAAGRIGLRRRCGRRDRRHHRHGRRRAGARFEAEEPPLLAGAQGLQALHQVGVGSQPVVQGRGGHPLAVDGDAFSRHFDRADRRLGLAGLEHDAALHRQHLVAAFERLAQAGLLLRRGGRVVPDCGAAGDRGDHRPGGAEAQKKDRGAEKSPAGG